MGNSPTIDDGELNPNNIGNAKNRLIGGVNLGYAFRGGVVEGLKIGAHWFRGDVREEASSARTTLNVLGGDTFYENRDWEIFAEYYRFDNTDRTGGTGSHGSWAGFLQVGHTFGRWTPYGRLEHADLDQSDNYFRQLATGRAYTREILGVRYELTPRAALKLELTHTTVKEGPTRNDDAAQMQYSIAF